MYMSTRGSVAIQEVKPEIEVKVTPNPVDDRFMIQCDTKPGTSARINVYNINGELMKTITHKSNTAGVQRQVDISDFPSGSYLLEIITDEEKARAILIKPKK